MWYFVTATLANYPIWCPSQIYFPRWLQSFPINQEAEKLKKYERIKRSNYGQCSQSFVNKIPGMIWVRKIQTKWLTLHLILCIIWGWERKSWLDKRIFESFEDARMIRGYCRITREKCKEIWQKLLNRQFVGKVGWTIKTMKEWDLWVCVFLYAV